MKTRPFITTAVAAGLVFAPAAAFADDSTPSAQKTAADTTSASADGCDAASQTKLSALELLSRLDAPALEVAEVTEDVASASDCTVSPFSPDTAQSGAPESIAPRQAVEPVEPVDPIAPVEPDTPVDPVAPVDPVDPVVPVDPVQPVQPVDPSSPVTLPAWPEMPVGPVGVVEQQQAEAGAISANWVQGPYLAETAFQQAATPQQSLAVTGSSSPTAIVLGSAAALVTGTGLFLFGRRKRAAATDLVGA